MVTTTASDKSRQRILFQKHAADDGQWTTTAGNKRRGKKRAALGYEVSGFPLPHTNLRPLPPGVWHWAVVLGNIVLLLSLPRRRRRQICLQTRAAMALPPTMSPTRITGAPSSWRCTEGCDERRSTVKNRVNQRSSDGTLRYVLLHEQAPGSRARDKIKIGDPGGGATGG